MFGPKRKLGARAQKHIDPAVTQEVYDRFVRDLERLKKQVRPRLSKEVMELAHGGDFSENAGYQAAKGRLRSVNNKIAELEQRIKKANIIQKPAHAEIVEIGHTVRIRLSGREHIYTILGSTESNPSEGVISYSSPLGKALVGKSAGDTFSFDRTGKTIEGIVLSIQ